MEEILMDRAFDAACLKVKGETEWANQIIARMKSTKPEYTGWIDNLVEFYTNMVCNNTSFLARADYMIEHKGKLKLRFK